MVERLKSIACKATYTERMEKNDSLIDDFFGGNIDDAFYGGCSEGEIYLAREVLEYLNIEYEVK